MALERYLTADISLFLFFILLMISIVHWRLRGGQSFQVKLFVGLCNSTMLMMLLDVLFRFFNGGNSAALIYTVTWFYFLVEPIPMLFWLCYLDFYLHKSQKHLKRKLYYLPIFIVILVLLLADPFTHWTYSIDKDNLYRRGPLVPLIVFFNFFVLIITLATAFIRKRDVGRRFFISLVLFSILPIIGNLLQFIFHGTVILWPSVALAVIYLYIFLESQKDRKDYLTGLINKQQMDDMIQNRLSSLDRKRAFSLVMIDLDDFKTINDSFGHKEGDRALVKAAELINNSLRLVDKVSRFGGDEFLVLLEEDNKEEVDKVILRLYEEIRFFNSRNLVPYSISLSCGYKIITQNENKSLYDHIHEADQDMYRNKRQRKAARLSMNR